MESVAAIGARIDAIEARLASLSGSPTSSASSASGRTAATAAASLLPAAGGTSAAAGTGTFAAALAAAQGGAAATGAAGLGGGPSSFATLLAGLRPAALGGPSALAGSTSATAAASPAAVPTTGPAAASLKGYGNGRIPPEALASIGGGERLWAPAAAAFTKMRTAASAAGVRLGVNDSYRSFDEQVDVARRKGLYSAGGLAAQPGTSDHGWGKAVDLQLDGKAQSWMRAHGAEFGFAEDTPREPWHWAYTG